MTTSAYEDVLLAVLSLDAYLRDSRKVAQRFLPNRGNQIGTATVLASSDSKDITGNQFFAEAYSDSTYGTIISYRGIISLGGVIPAVGVASGTITSQVQLAAQFYQTITSGLGVSPFAANVTFTGHSLGGALAGIVSSVYDQQAVVFDNVGFENVLDTISSNLTGGNNSRIAQTISTFYSFLAPGAAIPPIVENVSGYAVAGDVAYRTRVFQTAPVTTMSAGFPPWPGGLTGIQLHDVGLAAILTYGKNIVPQSSSWQDAAAYFTGYLFSDPIAKALGLKDDPTDGYTADYFMRAEIAYSAISSGVMPYGDTGIASLYADAGTLGTLIDNSSLAGLASGLKVSEALGEIIVQQAGDLAASQNTSSAAANGALSLDQSNKILTINLDPSNWTQSIANAPVGATRPNIIGLGDLATAVLSNYGAGNSASEPAEAWITSVANGSNAAFTQQLDQTTLVKMSLSGGSGNLSGANAPDNGGAFLIGQLGTGSITGSASGNDIIVGGTTITTGTGNDKILTGQTETINDGGCQNLIFAQPGGEDNDTFNYAHHDIGDVPNLSHSELLRRQLADFLHHGDKTIPPQQVFGRFARSLLAGLGVPVENRYGLHPAAQADGLPSPIEVETALDRLRLLQGVRTFNLHPHLPQLERIGDAVGKLDVLVRQKIDLTAPPHPFARERADFDALLQSRPDAFAGTLLVSDTTLWSSTAGGVESLRQFWTNVVQRPHRA